MSDGSGKVKLLNPNSAHTPDQPALQDQGQGQRTKLRNPNVPDPRIPPPPQQPLVVSSSDPSPPNQKAKIKLVNPGPPPDLRPIGPPPPQPPPVPPTVPISADEVKRILQANVHVPPGPGMNVPSSQVPVPPPANRSRRQTSNVLSMLAIAAMITAVVLGSVYAANKYKKETPEAEPFPVPNGSSAGVPLSSVPTVSPASNTPVPNTMLDEASRVRLKNATVVIRVKYGSEALGLGGMGSGFFVSEDGLIVTNHHVIADTGPLPGRISLQLNGWGNEIEDVVCVADDARLDLALLRARSAKPPAILSVYRGPRVPETTPVAVIGHPRGELWSITLGAITGYREHKGQPFYGTDARIEPGNSGGPVTLRTSGEVIGVSDWKVLGSGLNYAIPADVLAGFIDEKGRGPGKPCGGTPFGQE